MLESISLKFTELAEPLSVPAQGVTVFVGPNNAGKSLVLREIEQFVSVNKKVETKVLNDLEIVWPSERQVEDDLANLSRKAPRGTSVDQVYLGRFNPNGSLDAHTVPIDALRNQMRERNNKRWVSFQFLRFFLIRLDGRTRFELTNDRPRGDLLGLAQNMLMHLFQDGNARKRVRDIVYDAFGVYFTVEQLSADNLRIRLSPTEPDQNEQHWSQEAREFHRKALYIKAYSSYATGR